MNIYKKFSLLLAVALFLISSFSGYQIALATTGGGTATIAVDGGSQVAGVTVAQSTSHKFSTVLTIPGAGMTLGAASPTFTIPTGFTAPTLHAVANSGLVDADGKWSVVAIGCTVDSAPTSLTTVASGQVITVDITADCANGNTITLTYKGTSAIAMGATALTVSTADAGSTGPVTPLIAGSPTITVTSVATANVNFALTTPAENGTTNHLTGGGATYGVNADVVKGATSVVITGTKIAGQTIVVGDYDGPPDDSPNVTPGGTATAPTYTVNTTTPGDNVSLTGGNKTFILTVSEAGKSNIVYTINVQVAVPTIISATAIAGVTPPVTGATPVTTVTAGTGYTGTVSWSGSPTTFASTTTYTATITLTATSGYTLTGVTENQFTIASSTSDTNPASSGVITAVFPATVAATTPSSGSSGSIPRAINLLALSGECKLGDLFSVITGKSCLTNIPHEEQVTKKFIFTLFLKMGPPYKLNLQGNEVIELQKFLNGALYKNGLVVDGNFGPKTKIAVIKFQLTNRLSGDGVVGPLTRVFLNK